MTKIVFSLYVVAFVTLHLHHCVLAKPPKLHVFQTVALEFINELRAKHHAPPLVSDAEFNLQAQAAVEDMGMNGRLGHGCFGRDCSYSENSAITSPDKNVSISIKKAITTWYNEISNYDFATGERINSMSNSHFTTLVWKSAKKIGIGAATKNVNDYNYIAIQISPKTNIPGQFIKNVRPAGNDPTDTNEIEPEEIITTTTAASIIIQTKTKKTTTEKPAPTPTVEGWQALVLNRINELRAKHCSPPLELDAEMTDRAQQWAEHLAAEGALISSNSNGKYGENLGQGPPNKNLSIGANFLVDYFYKKLKVYDFAAGKGKGTNTFTQFVWKESKKIGIGGANGHPAIGPSESLFAVFQFLPAGNMEGGYRFNVQKPTEPSECKPDVEQSPTDSATERKKYKFKCPTKQPCSQQAKGGFSEVQKAGLQAINALRKKHGADPVCLDENLNTNCKYWAESLSAIGNLALSCMGNDCCYGEIQAVRKPNDNITAEVQIAIQKWYEESKDYDYKTGLAKQSTKIITGFTALVWKGSTKVGISAFANPRNEIPYVVIEFSPPGNTRYQYVANVQPLKS